MLKGKICAFAGNTGVGKSSLLNNIDSSLELATGETSKKLGRGSILHGIANFLSATKVILLTLPDFLRLILKDVKKL